MAADGRIPGHPRGRAVTFWHDGRPHKAHEGETVGAALLADDVAVLSRSIKYHRPRGLWCCRGECANCLVRVDGRPNARACMTPVRDGMRVESQNAFPSARRDLLAVVDKVYRRQFDPHDKFLRPRPLAAGFQWVVRRMAGFGRVPDTPLLRPRTRPIARVAPDVLVAGAGAAGLAAAEAAAAAGLRVLVLEWDAAPGGSLRLERGADEAEASLAAARKAGADVRTSTPVVARYPEGEALALGPNGLLEVRPRALVVATGSHDVPRLFAGNDLPGVLSARGALTLLARDGVRPGRRAVVVGEGAEPERLALRLREAGVEVAAVVPVVEAAEGGTRVEACRLPHGARLACDTLVVAGGRAPRPELVQQAGCRLRWDAALGAALPEVDADGRTSAPGVWACGEVAGAEGPEAAQEAGRRTGRAVAEALAKGGRA